MSFFSKWLIPSIALCSVFVWLDRKIPSNITDDVLENRKLINSFLAEKNIDWDKNGQQHCRVFSQSGWYKYQICYVVDASANSSSNWKAFVYFHPPRPHLSYLKTNVYFRVSVFGQILGTIKYDALAG